MGKTNILCNSDFFYRWSGVYYFKWLTLQLKNIKIVEFSKITFFNKGTFINGARRKRKESLWKSCLKFSALLTLTRGSSHWNMCVCDVFNTQSQIKCILVTNILLGTTALNVSGFSPKAKTLKLYLNLKSFDSTANIVSFKILLRLILFIVTILQSQTTFLGNQSNLNRDSQTFFVIFCVGGLKIVHCSVVWKKDCVAKYRHINCSIALWRYFRRVTQALDIIIPETIQFNICERKNCTFELLIWEPSHL